MKIILFFILFYSFVLQASNTSQFAVDTVMMLRQHVEYMQRDKLLEEYELHLTKDLCTRQKENLQDQAAIIRRFESGVFTKFGPLEQQLKNSQQEKVCVMQENLALYERQFENQLTFAQLYKQMAFLEEQYELKVRAEEKFLRVIDFNFEQNQKIEKLQQRLQEKVDECLLLKNNHAETQRFLKHQHAEQLTEKENKISNLEIQLQQRDSYIRKLYIFGGICTTGGVIGLLWYKFG